MSSSLPQEQQHFLLVGMPIQSQINPILRLARRLTSLGARVTFSTSVHAHRRMFPDTTNAGAALQLPLDDPSDPLLSYHPYSDGYDGGGREPNPDAVERYMTTVRVVGAESLFAVASSAKERRVAPPVTCVVYALLAPWASLVARRLGVPSFLFWIQPASLFLVYYHYSHEYRSAIDEVARNRVVHFVADDQDCSSSLTAVELPGLPRLEARDLPPTISGPISHSDVWTAAILRDLERTFHILDEEIAASPDRTCRKPKVLVNTFDALEEDALNAISKTVELIPVGPVLPPNTASSGVNTSSSNYTDIIKHQNSTEDMHWLNQWPDKSVVYISFGSFFVLAKEQVDEFAKAIVATGRPFLWVLRNNIVRPDEELVKSAVKERGKIVGWCNQVEVLEHPSVGCFVTHCGWNSTSEAIAAGVPMVAVPFSTDQPMNARLVESLWRVGLMENLDSDGIVRAPGLAKAVQIVMGDSDDGVAIRRNAAELRDKARAAVGEGGSSDGNLKSFVNSLSLTPD